MMDDAIQTPVLLVIFKRPQLTRRAIRAIAAARPATLLIAADGPRGDFEAALCEEARAVISEVDWPCTVITNFSDTNLGCGVRMHTAITWAFTLSEEVIILEDDCVPNPSFFSFCEELLAYYRTDERVMHVSGNNFVGSKSLNPYSYYFSKYTHAWGWATWRRAWQHFDWSMRQWPELRDAGLLETCCRDPYERDLWRSTFDQMHQGAPDVWDYQWNFACWSQSGLVVIPSVNLVSNIGFGDDATHTKSESGVLSLPTFAMDEIHHPPFVVRDESADAITYDRNFGGAESKARNTPKARLRRSLEPALRQLRRLKRGLKDLTGRSV